MKDCGLYSTLSGYVLHQITLLLHINHQGTVCLKIILCVDSVYRWDNNSCLRDMSVALPQRDQVRSQRVGHRQTLWLWHYYWNTFQSDTTSGINNTYFDTECREQTDIVAMTLLLKHWPVWHNFRYKQYIFWHRE